MSRKPRPSASRLASFAEPLERRLMLAAGDPDTSFSDDGEASFQFGGIDIFARDVAVQNDGKSVIVGHARPGIDGFPTSFAVLRLNLDGTPDQTFGPDRTGLVRTNIVRSSGDEQIATCVKVRGDGKIVVAGRATLDSVIDPRFGVARYLPSGALDETFDGDGVRTIEIENISAAEEITLVGDKIIIVGNDLNGIFDSNFDFAIARLNDDGSLDESFSDNGRRIIGFDAHEFAQAVAVDTNGPPETSPNFGKIVIAGNREGGEVGEPPFRYALARLNPDGDLDADFDGNGQLTATFPGYSQAFVQGLVIQPNGRIVVAGHAVDGTAHGVTPIVLARYFPDGSLDLSFGSEGNGNAYLDLGGADEAQDLIQTQDGRLIVAVTRDGIPGLAAFTADGDPDPSFGTGGVVMTDLADVSSFFGPGLGLARGPGLRFTLAGGPTFQAARFLDAGTEVAAIGTFDPGGSEAGREPGRFIVGRTKRLNAPLRVFLNVSGTATAPLFIPPTTWDYEPEGFSMSPIDGSTFVDIPANQTFVDIAIVPIDDSRNEGTETVTLSIAPGPGYEAGTPASITMDIIDSEAATNIVQPIADAFVRSGVHANTNFGTDLQLETKRTPDADRNRETFLKFDTTALPQSLTNVKLRVRGRLEANNPTAIPTAVFGVSNSGWTETGITFNNRPAPSTGTLASVNVGTTTETVFDFDVTDFIRNERNAGRNIVTLMLRNAADSSPVTLWASREAGVTVAPQLVANTLRIAPAPGPPNVVRVFVDGTTWTPAFRQHLEATGLGDSDWGLSVNDGAGQLATLPWANADRVRIRFNRDVRVNADHLAVFGANVYPRLPGAAGFNYDATNHVATWTFATPFAKDQILLDLDATVPVNRGDPTGVAGAPDGIVLDGEWSNDGTDAYPSGNGTRGGDFRFLINSLPGDVDGNGTVSVGDVGVMSTHFGQSPRGPREGDLTGDGLVSVADVGILSSRFGQSLPGSGLALDGVAGAAETVTAPAKTRRAAITGLLVEDVEGA